MCYTQKDLINDIHEETGFSIYEIERVFEAYEFLLQEYLTSEAENVVVKIMSGLSVKKEEKPSDGFSLKQCGAINSDKLVYLSANFSDYYKRKINTLLKKRLN